MVDVAKQIVSTLSPILPTYYEQFIDDKTPIPCISYIEQGNYEYKKSEQMGYSYITFLIKLYTREGDNLQSYSQQIDTKMREIGYSRVSAQDVVIDDLSCKWITYRGLAVEYYGET